MSKIKICLDAGHFGKTNQSPVVKNYYESDMNWKLHLLLKKYLEQYGIEVKLTRSAKENDLGLSKRGEASKGCNLFLSLHSNACNTESVDRPVAICFVDDDCGVIDEESKKVAALLGEVVQKVMETNGKYQVYSKAADFDRDGDGLKNDEYYGVLNGAHRVGVAGVILEHSFHTNTRAAKWLLVDSNLDKLAQAEAKVLAEYYGQKKVEQDVKPDAVATDQIYRVRTSWDKPTSQIGAYKNLENAKKACKVGYSVYDKDGKEVYTQKATSYPVDSAKSFSAAKAGTYTVNATNLNLRCGASTSKQIIEEMAKGSTVRCYGYYTGSWLYVVSETGKAGFCHESYLKKK